MIAPRDQNQDKSNDDKIGIDIYILEKNCAYKKIITNQLLDITEKSRTHFLCFAQIVP